MTALATFIFACYCLSAFLIFRRLRNHENHARWLSLSPALLAICAQIFLLNQQIHIDEQLLNLSFFVAFSLISWLVSIQILIASMYRPLETLGIAMFPLSGLAVIISLLAPASATAISGDLLRGHIMVSVIAYSLIMLSALQAVALAYQDHAIRSHHPGGLIRFFPPLHDMETLLFQMLGFGFIFLTTGLISGFLFVDNLFAQHLVHKTALSIVGWFILATLLFGRYKFGWRGKKAIRWTIAAFVFIMLAYFGSKFVLEIILQKV